MLRFNERKHLTKCENLLLKARREVEEMGITTETRIEDQQYWAGYIEALFDAGYCTETGKEAFNEFVMEVCENAPDACEIAVTKPAEPVSEEMKAANDKVKEALSKLNMGVKK